MDTATNNMNIPQMHEAKILGVRYTSTIPCTSHNKRPIVTNTAKRMAHDMFLFRRIQFVHIFMHWKPVLYSNAPT
jgi:hypothetical protein